MQSPPKKVSTEQDFEQKLNQMVRIIKLKQQICFQTIEYLQQIVKNKEELQRLMFLQDQISKHKHFLDKVNRKNSQCRQKQKSANQLYSQSGQLTQTERNLVRRVSARILELLQSYNEKTERFAHFQKQISQHYKTVKPKFLKHINQVQRKGSTGTTVWQLFISFFTYLQTKFQDQCKKLVKVTEVIESGELSNIQSAFICQHCKQLQAKAANKSQRKSLNVLSSSKQLEVKQALDNQQLKFFSKEKDKINENLRAMRLQAKNKELILKNKAKFASKHYRLYQSAMDVHKGHFMDQFTFIDEKQRSNKILADMQARNKHNEVFIKQYIHEYSEKNIPSKNAHKAYFFPKKLTYHTTQIEDEYMIKKDISQTHDHVMENDHMNLSIDEDKKEQVRIIKPLKNEIFEICVQNEQKQDKSEVKSFRITNTNKKNVIPTPKSNPNLFSIKQMGQSYNFVKINMKNAQNQRARLPDISNRMFSIDQKHKSTKLIDRQENFISSNNNLIIIKTSLKKPTVDSKKNEKRKVVEQHNRIQNVMTRLQKNVDNQRKAQNPHSKNKKLIKRSESGNKLANENNDKNQARTLEINYSTSIAKKINKFCESASLKEEIS